MFLAATGTKNTTGGLQTNHLVKTIMAQQNQKNNPKLVKIEEKIFNNFSSADDFFKNADNFGKQIEELTRKQTEARELGEKFLESGKAMAAQKTRILEASEILKQLGAEFAAIAIELANENDSTDPEPEQQREQETQPKAQAETQTEPEATTIAASDTLPGETASEQIANVQAKKPEPQQEQASEALPVCLERDNYSFKFDNPQTKGIVKGEFATPEGDFFKFTASGKNKKYVGLQPEGAEFFTYTSNVENWKAEWDRHLSPIEKALQEYTGDKELAVKYPPRISNAIAETKTERKVEYRDNELPFIDCVAVAKPGHSNGYSISFVSCQDYATKKGVERCGLKLKMVGEGTTISGRHVFINFDKNSAEYEIGIEVDGKLVHDGKKENREAMPKNLEPLRRAAVLFLEKRLPEFRSRWESGITYVTPDPEPKGPAGPAAAADNPVK